MLLAGQHKALSSLLTGLLHHVAQQLFRAAAALIIRVGRHAEYHLPPAVLAVIGHIIEHLIRQIVRIGDKAVDEAHQPSLVLQKPEVVRVYGQPCA